MKEQKIAILIDGDNAENRLIEQYISEAGRFGRITVKRIYADWTSNQMNGWKDQLNKFAVRPIQKFAYTVAKNSTDTALIIDAMDLLHSKVIDGICIVSSDSDYTGLAYRIREEGLFMMGIGRAHTPEAFIKSCEIFTFSEIIQPKEIKETKKIIQPNEIKETKKIIQPKEIKETKKIIQPKDAIIKETKKIIQPKDAIIKEKVKTKTNTNTNNHSKIPSLQIPKPAKKLELNLIGSLQDSSVKSINLEQIESAFQMVVDVNTGQAYLSNFSQALHKVDPTFDHRNFGYNSFRKFCGALTPNFQIVVHKDGTTISLKKID